ncbi:MAG: MCE family protein, partial [Syntrophaceae bacterium]|nr:MCE family protein [Syntrophaceae bacterium]
GPMITIVFKKAEGVEAGKTFVKYKDVNIGQVRTVKLSEDFTRVVVTAQIDKSAEDLLVEDAKFWIESARVTLSGISGMGTVLSGNHIGLEVGKSARERRAFIGLEMPPAVTVDQPGRQFVLQSDDLGSINIGSPVYYRDFNVGRVIGYDLTRDGNFIEIRIFVNAPYDKYVTADTRFWHASGLDVSLGANGLSVQTKSVLSLLIGGIAFEAPTPATDTRPAPESFLFTLFDDRSTAINKHEDVVANFVLYFKEPLRGLSVGAPVTFAGLPVGTVTGVGLEFNPPTEEVQPRVDIALYPTRFLAHVKNAAGDFKKRDQGWRRDFLQRMIDRGLRAQLRSGNLVTGQLYVALERFPGAPKAKRINWSSPPCEFPVMTSSMQDLETRVHGIISKLDRLPLDAIGQDVRQALDTLTRTFADADKMINRLDGEIAPEVAATLADLRKTLATAERTLAGADSTLVGKDAPAQQELRSALQEISRAARSISDLVEYLERNPNALIRGKAQEVSP